MNNITVFNNPEFGQIRTVEVKGEPWFVAADVCRALEIKDTWNAMARLDEDEKGTDSISTPGGAQQMAIVNEPGLYSLILGSRKPEAKAFKRWITHEVIPAIRKHGVYAVDDMLNNPDAMIAALQALKAERERNRELSKKNECLSEQVSELKPKASYYDLVLGCNNALPITVIAKDYGWTGRQMNKFLADQGIQYKMGSTWLLYSEYADIGYTKSNTTVFTSSDGSMNSKVHTKWTQKGRLFIYNIMKAAGFRPMMEQETA